VSHLSADVIVHNSLHSHIYKLPNQYCLSYHCVSLQIDRLQALLQSRSIIACKCITKLTWSWPPFHLWVLSFSVANWLSKFTRLWPPSASPNLIDHCLQVHLWVHAISDSKCVSEFTQCWFPIASQHSLDHGLRMYRWIHSILVSHCISKPAWSQPQSIALTPLKLRLQLHLQISSITAS
jgi:hypothetical protein